MTQARQGDFGRDLVITGAANLAVPVATAFTAPLLARALGVDGRGELAAATAPLILMIAVATFGLPEAVIYFTARRPEAARHHLVRGTLGLLVGGLLAMALTILLADWFAGDVPHVAGLLVALAATIPLTVAVGALRGAASGLHRWDLVAAEKFLNGALRLGGMYGLAAFDRLTVVTAALATLLPPIAAAVAYLPLRRITKGGEASGTGLGEMAGYGGMIWGGAVSGILLSRLDQALLAPFAGATQLGYYSVAVSVADIVILANSAMRDVTLASDAGQQDNARIFRTARVSLAIALLLAVLVLATIAWWFDALFGADFGAAIPMAFVLIAGAALATPGSVLGAGLSARGHPGLRSLSLAIACVVNILLLLLLAPSLGGVGAAWATLVGSLLASALNSRWFFRRFGGTWRDAYLPRREDVSTVGATLGRLFRRRGRR